jgi:hypothetical protein
MAWPDHFPDACPPADADAVGTFYRFVLQDPPIADDFVSLWLKRDGNGIATEVKCKSCGLSLFTDLNDVEKARRKVPAFRPAKVAMGVLSTVEGKIKPTPSMIVKSHHTWWVPKGLAPEPLFKVIQMTTKEQK